MDAPMISVHVDHQINIIVSSVKSVTYHASNGSLRESRGKIDRQINFPGSLKQFVEHLLHIFKEHKIDDLEIMCNSVYQYKPDIQALKGIKMRTLKLRYQESILKMFGTSADRIEFSTIKSAELENSKDILIQNFDYLKFDFEGSLTADNLIGINGKVVNIWAADIEMKDVNIFLKHWLKGSNPRLEKLILKTYRLDTDGNSVEDSVADLFRDLDCESIAESQFEILRDDESIAKISILEHGYWYNKIHCYFSLNEAMNLYTTYFWDIVHLQEKILH